MNLVGTTTYEGTTKDADDLFAMFKDDMAKCTSAFEIAHNVNFKIKKLLGILVLGLLKRYSVSPCHLFIPPSCAKSVTRKDKMWINV